MRKLKTIRKFSEKFRATLLTLVASAFGFVAALFWNDAIRAGIETLLPPAQSLSYKFTAAIFATAISVIVIYLLSKYSK